MQNETNNSIFPSSQTDVQPIQQVDEQAMKSTKEIFKKSFLKAIANWWYSIAGLSFVNTILDLAKSGVTFPIGLSVNVVAALIPYVLFPDNQMIYIVVSIVFTAITSGIFVLLGFLTSKGHIWATYIALGLYIVDTLLTIGIMIILGGDVWMLVNIGFHAYAIYRAVSLILGLRKLK